MDKVLTILKNVAKGLPYLTFLTVILYMAGRDYNANYWQGVGLPLMATDHTFADMLYDGFLGYVLWTASFLGPHHSPVTAILVASAVVVALYRGLEFGATRLMRRLIARRADPQAPAPHPMVARVLGEVEKLLGYFVVICLPLLAVPILVGMSVVTPALPAVAIGGKGFEQGHKELVLNEARFRQLRDGLVDATFVNVTLAEGEKAIKAVPIECAGDRCAAMTQSGPISLPKDRFGEEAFVTAVWNDTCLSAEGLARRRRLQKLH